MVAPQVATVPLREGRYPQAPIGPRLGCPACGSPDIRKLSLVWREGTGGPHEQSALSRDAAPPAPRDEYAGCGGCAVAVAVFMVTSIVVGAIAVNYLGTLVGTDVLWLAAFVFAAFLAFAAGLPYKHRAAEQARFNRDELPRLLAEWDATFLCMRCEQRFIP